MQVLARNFLSETLWDYTAKPLMDNASQFDVKVQMF